MQGVSGGDKSRILGYAKIFFLGNIQQVKNREMLGHPGNIPSAGVVF